MRSAVFLDRDNTILANDGDLGDPESVRLLAGAADGIASLRRAGFVLVVVTNQGGVARGRYDEAAVHAVHRALENRLRRAAAIDRAIDLYLHCPYHPDGTVAHYRRDHPWRKPAPGMLLAAAAALDIDLSASWMVGDAPRDLEAGRQAGCRTIALTGRSPVGGSSTAIDADHTVTSLADAAVVIVADRSQRLDRAERQGASPDA